MTVFEHAKSSHGTLKTNALTQFTLILDFLLPRLCVSCKEKLNTGEKIICTSCRSKIQIPSNDRLRYEFKKKFENDKIISGFNTAFVFEKDGVLQDAIHALKYQSMFLIGKFWGEILADSLNNEINSWHIDYIVPVPLHRLKKIERGYNQSFYIAKGLSKKMDIELNNKVLKRVKYTRSQTKLNLEERKQNMKDAFIVKNKGQIKGKNILLIDDIITTGATISECGRVLLQNGATKVFSASIAIAN